MKTLILVLVSGCLSLISVSGNATEVIGTSGSNKSKEKSLFILKTNKKFIGARVEIFQANGALIAAQHLEKKKVVIDFSEVRKGSYTIRVSKGQEKQEYLYVRN